MPWSRCLVFACVGLMACGSTNEGAVEEVGQSAAALSVGLASRTGTLCYVEKTAGFHRNVGFAEPGADGFIDSALPQAEAVLGGTGTSLGYRLAQTEVEFEVTDMRKAWDNGSYGPRQQVCAEISVRNPCNLERACWHADGGWSLEKKSNPGQVNLDECGSAGESIVYEDNGTDLASPLVAGGQYVLHVDVAEDGAVPQLTVGFFKKWSYFHIVQRDWTAPQDGFSGMRHDRMGIRAAVFGQIPTTYDEPVSGACLDCAGTTSVHAQGDAQGLTGPLSCRHSGGTFLPPERFRVTGQFCEAPTGNSLAWDRPAGITAAAISGYTVFRDGYEVCSTGALSCNDFFKLLPNQKYTYQVGWRDLTGKLRDLATLGVTTPSACRPSEYADGVHKLGVVLMRFSYAPPGYPFTLAQAREAVSTHPNSATAFISETSRGTAALQAEAHDWIDLPAEFDNVCKQKSPVAGGGQNGFNCNLGSLRFRQYAQQRGIPVDSYDSVIFAIHGLGIAGISSGFMGVTNQNIDTSTIIHEMLGHNYGLNHAGDWICIGRTPITPGPNLADPLADGCTVGRYGDWYDPMGVSPRHFNTINLLRLGWLQSSEVAVAKPGEAYWIGKLDSNVYPLRQLQVPLDHPFQYYLEYRRSEGFNALQPCATCNPRINASAIDPTGVTVRAVWEAFKSGGSSSQYDIDNFLVGLRPLRTGQTLRDNYRKLNINVLEENDQGAKVQVVWD